MTTTRPTRHLRALLLPLVLPLVAALVVALSACAAPAPIRIGDDTVIIDVRTPAEFAEGHLDGAVNADLSSGEFARYIAGLPTDGEYLVYCRSGNRSAQAAKLMVDAGFADVIDAGGLGAASSATGIPVVR